MRIWHVGCAPDPDLVDGVNHAVWNLAVAQARSGHEVTLLTSRNRSGVRPPGDLHVVPAGEPLPQPWPDLVHMHSVFVPRQAALALQLRTARVPYVVTPHGGLHTADRHRSRWRKAAYSLLVERDRLRHAAAVTASLDAEVRDLATFVGLPTVPLVVIPNAVGGVPFRADVPREHSCADVVYLGRFDMLGKNLERWVRLAALLPTLSFALYGPRREHRNILSMIPPNVTIHEPVFGADKWRVLRSARSYLQTSRWDSFGISVVEALQLGTPCAVSSTMNIADIIRTHQLGAVLNVDDQHAARQVEALTTTPHVGGPSRLSEYARRNFGADVVARQVDRLYSQVLSGSLNDRHRCWSGGGTTPTGWREMRCVPRT